MKKMSKNTEKLCFLAVSCAAAMVLSYVESLIPIGIPGVKIGLPNIFIIVILYTYGTLPAAAVSLTRCLLTSLLFGSIMSLWYSLAGAVLSLFVMSLLKKYDIFSPVGVSVCGGVLHNGAQIGVAVLVTGVKEISCYLPVLIFSGTAAGILVGIAAGISLKKLGKLK